MTTKEALHQLIEQLSEQDLEHAVSYLAFLHERAQRDADPVDAMETLLQALPAEDESITTEEDTGEQEGWAEYQQYGGLSRDTARRQMLGESPR